MQQSTTKQLRTSTATVSYNPLGTYKTAAHRHKFRKLKLQGLDFFFSLTVKDLGQIPIEFLYTSTLLYLFINTTAVFALFFLWQTASIDQTTLSQVHNNETVTMLTGSHCYVCLREQGEISCERVTKIQIGELWPHRPWFSFYNVLTVIRIFLSETDECCVADQITFKIFILCLWTLWRGRTEDTGTALFSDIEWQWTIDDSEQVGGNFPSVVSHHFCFLWLHYIPQISSKLPYYICSCFLNSIRGSH